LQIFNGFFFKIYKRFMALCRAGSIINREWGCGRLFGYVRVCKARMTCGDYAVYRGVYCSLCKALGRRYGPLARLTLRYDMAFYALLALRKAGDTEFAPARCSFNPLKKCLCCKSAAIDAAADVSMLMAYYKWRDTLRDSAWYARLLWAPAGIFFLWAGCKAKRRAPQAERIIRVAVAAQAMQEAGYRRQEAGEDEQEAGYRKKEAGYRGQEAGEDVTPDSCILTPDACSHPSAHALGALCALLDAWLYRLGYLLGRWVYLMDAADDCEDDRKRGRFNPFLSGGSDPGGLIRATSAELAGEWEALEACVEPDADARTPEICCILENILTLGLAAMEQKVLKEMWEMRQRKEGEANEKSL
jgi:hypothetical protein